MTAALFFVSGEPVPQGSKRAFVVRGRPVIVDANKRTKSWQNTVREAARSFRLSYPAGFPLEGAVTLGINFSMPTPKTKRKAVEKSKILPVVKPDIDKLARGLIDALTGILIVDDAQIVELYVTKIYTLNDPGANITLTPYDSSPTARLHSSQNVSIAGGDKRLPGADGALAATRDTQSKRVVK